MKEEGISIVVDKKESLSRDLNPQPLLTSSAGNHQTQLRLSSAQVPVPIRTLVYYSS